MSLITLVRTITMVGSDRLLMSAREHQQEVLATTRTVPLSITEASPSSLKKVRKRRKEVPCDLKVLETPPKVVRAGEEEPSYDSDRHSIAHIHLDGVVRVVSFVPIDKGVFLVSSFYYRRVRDFASLDEKVAIEQMGVEVMVSEAYQCFARLGLLLPGISNKTLSGQSYVDCCCAQVVTFEEAIANYEVLVGKLSEQDTVLEARHADDIAIMDKMHEQHRA
ncbi:hypothetical protein L1987_15682 [Smallanthus sonchifolius]|uniref:Uncharacterized protein n=1 Tax=Smallanthus sonchifolius TaxID=185202 RepID=A0ACB9J7S4_9ASTR|nr:hypothetical protein L1987_15682 [Smallanthus sonchifolius]